MTRWLTLCLVSSLTVSCGEDGLPSQFPTVEECTQGACRCEEGCAAAEQCDLSNGLTTNECVLACLAGDVRLNSVCRDDGDCSCVASTSREVSGLGLYGTWPAARRPSGSWHRQCDPGPTNGVMLDVLLTTTGPITAEPVAREGDWLDFQQSDAGDGTLLAPHTHVDLRLAPLHAPMMPTDTVHLGPADVFDYHRIQSPAARPATLVMVDASAGLETFPTLAREAEFFLRNQTLSGEGAIIFFNEIGLTTCSPGRAPILERLEPCMPRQDDIMLTEHPLFVGRSNLWSALAETYAAAEVLAARGDGVELVVITGRPDGCSLVGVETCGPPCPESTGVELVRELVDRAQGPGGSNLRVSFLHVDESGEGPDPSQWDIACRSGGHYLYTPRFSPNSDPDGVSRVLRELLHNAPGYWRAIVETAQLPLAAQRTAVAVGGLVLMPEAGLGSASVDANLVNQAGLGTRQFFVRTACSPDVGCSDPELHCSPTSLTCVEQPPASCP